MRSYFLTYFKIKLKMIFLKYNIIQTYSGITRDKKKNELNSIKQIKLKNLYGCPTVILCFF